MTLLQKIVFAALALAGTAAFGQLTISGNLPDGAINQAYSAQLTCNGSSASQWSASPGLPPGLGFTPIAGVPCAVAVSGTPTAGGTFIFTVSVFDEQSEQPPAQKQFTVRISGNLTVTSPVILPSGVVNQNYSYQLGASGGTPPYSWTLPPSGGVPNVLPQGLTLNSAGAISGLPTVAGTFGFDITVTDTAKGSVTTHFELAITQPLTFTTSSPLVTGTVNTSYSLQIAVSGGTTPYTFSITTPATAPPGIVITGPGLLSGVPKSTGTYTFTIQVMDKFGFTASKQYQLSIAPPGALLQTSVRSLTFAGMVGGDTPPQQSIAVTAPSGTPVNFAVTVDGGSAGTAAPGWITVSPTGGPVPGAIIVTANQSALQQGKYSATIHVSVPSNTSQTPIDIAVTFNVTSAPSQVQPLPTSLHFAARAVTPSAQDQLIVISNTGGGGGFSYSTSVVGKSSWISAVTPASGRIGVNSPAVIRVFVNTQGLKPGFYHDAVRITATSGSVDVPVESFVSDQGPVLGLSSSGIRFQARQGAGLAETQTVSVLNLGDSTTTSAWQAKLISGSEWLSLSGTTGTATPLRPGTLTLTTTAGAANLSTGGHYALISVSDPNAINSPVYLTAVLDVEPASSPALPDPAPQGLFFTSGTAAQTVLINTSSTDPVAFQVSAYTGDGNAWLAATPSSGTASTATPGKISVSISPGPLAVGVYSGLVNISMNGVLRSVNVTMIITTPPGPSAPSMREASGCTASRLALTQTGIVNNFAVPAGWPATLIVQVNDDCANAISNASVVATFSNGDPPISLRGDAVSNLYSATWQPGAVQPEMTVSVRASSANLNPATQQYTGAVNQNSFAPPTLVPNGALHIFFSAPMAAALNAGLAPGNVAQVYGTGMASSSSQTTVPLPPTFNGTFMLIGSEEAPLFYVSDQLLNVQVPVDLTPNRQYSLIVSANGALTTPSTIDVTPLQPGVAQFADGTVIAQISGTTTLITSSNPAKPGQNLTIYLAGMGPTDPVVPSGQPTPLQLVPATNQPTVTLDSQPVSFGYAGLTPTGIGLYQINLTVPSNARTGVLDLVVTQNGIAANTTKLPVSNQ